MFHITEYRLFLRKFLDKQKLVVNVTAMKQTSGLFSANSCYSKAVS